MTTPEASVATMEELVAQLNHAMADIIARGWAVSPPATVIALARMTAVIAGRHVTEHPEVRDAALAMLQSVVTLVEMETLPTTTRH